MGRVALAVSREEGSAVVRVRDSGVGIDPALAPHLFEPFTQAKQTIARSEGGLGLGLALVKALTELHGGRVAAASLGPDPGSEFTVAKVAARRPEVVLCDIGLPGMSGYEVAQALRKAHDGALRLVAISGYAQPEDVKRSIDAGFNAHVAKPPDPDRLERLLA